MYIMYIGCIKKMVIEFGVVKRVHYIMYRNHFFTVRKTRLLAFECHHFCEI